MHREMTGLLSLVDVAVEYRTLQGVVHAVNGVKLELGKGEVLGLVGETGAGKTTTALSVMGLLPKQAALQGDIMFDGLNLAGIGQKEYRNIRGNRISMVFQDPMSSLNPIFSVITQISETVRLHRKVSKEEANRLSISMLESVGISRDRAEEYPHEFSGGMIQRVMIAIALVCRPQLLILDEPTTALDVTIQAQVLALLRDLKKEFDTSMIFITHNLAIVPDICDSIAIMYGGKIVEQGSISSVYSRPRHPYTVNLFGCIPDIDDPQKEIKPMPTIPSELNTLSGGCLFYPRCDERVPLCATEAPHLASVSETQAVACFKHQ